MGSTAKGHVSGAVESRFSPPAWLGPLLQGDVGPGHEGSPHTPGSDSRATERVTRAATRLRRPSINVQGLGSPGSVAEAVPTSVQRFESDSLAGIGTDNVPVPKPLPCPRCPLSDLSPPTPVGVVTLVGAAGVVSYMSGRDLQPSDSVGPQRVAVLLPVNAVGERQIALVAAGIHFADGTHGQRPRRPTCRAHEVTAGIKRSVSWPQTGPPVIRPSVPQRPT